MKRAPKESAQAIEAYGIYRDMGPDRSLDRVAQECHKSRSLIARWSQVHGWQARIAEHERTVAQRRDDEAKEAEAAERAHLRKLRLSTAKSQQAIASRWITALLRRLSSDDEKVAARALAELSSLDVVRLIRSANDTQRLEYGEATERTEHSGEIAVRWLTPSEAEEQIARAQEQKAAETAMRKGRRRDGHDTGDSRGA